MPVPAKLVNVNRSADALRRLRVSPRDLAAAPQITPLLKEAAGGMKTVLSAMRLSSDPAILSFLKKYDALPVGDRSRVPMEAIALAEGIDMVHFLGAVLLSLQAQAVNRVKIIAMTSHPQITRARVKYGLMASGERDRTALDTAMGFLPSPKGPTFIGKAIFGPGRTEADDGGGDDDDDELDTIFPPANAMQQKLTAIRQKMLPETS
jgi:hypothetical protein